jgi:hypothetical protein
MKPSPIRQFGGMPHFDVTASTKGTCLLGIATERSRVLRVDADLRGLPEPLFDAEHGYFAQAHQQLACARSVGLHRCSPGSRTLGTFRF